MQMEEAGHVVAAQGSIRHCKRRTHKSAAKRQQSRDSRAGTSCCGLSGGQLPVVGCESPPAPILQEVNTQGGDSTRRGTGNSRDAVSVATAAVIGATLRPSPALGGAARVNEALHTTLVSSEITQRQRLAGDQPWQSGGRVGIGCLLPPRRCRCWCRWWQTTWNRRRRARGRADRARPGPAHRGLRTGMHDPCRKETR